MAIVDFIETKEETPHQKAQVKLDLELFKSAKKALKEDGLTFQQVLKAGIVSWLSERKKKGKS